ncbi:MAG: homoserine dehydrogenase family protein [Micavibrio sp.]|nr:homoserine dehydrogenase family protein [Micavibrio sp.]
MTAPLRIGIAGLGTVGAGVVKMLQQNAELITARAGRPVEVTCVSARDKAKKRDVDLSHYQWIDAPEAMASADVDIVVELMGGSEGTARNLVEASLKSGKAVITANKALLAEHGLALAALADAAKVPLMYEAAVAGGIPIIKALREGFAGNNIGAVYGILNGTCNYILTTMRETGRGFDDVLAEAQAKGYAEADPAFDVDGIDAAHKLSILTALAFGVKPAFGKVAIQGIRHITADDMEHARDLGYRIKLLGMARRMKDGAIVQTMEPTLVPQDSPIGAVDGVFNAVFVEGDFVHTSLLVGRGAGEGPTASAVLSDIIDIARGKTAPVYGVPADTLKDAKWGGAADIHSHFYMHLKVIDKTGVLADVAAILRDHNISVEAMIQRGRNPDQPVPIVMTTHETRYSDVLAACEKISGLKLVQAKPTVLRIEQF